VNTKTTIILLVILALLGAAVYFFKDEPEKGFREEEKMVAGFDAAKITQIRVENAERNEKVVLAKSGEEWEMREPIKGAADSAQARMLADFFSTYEGMRLGKVGDSSVNLAQLGLDKPRIVLEIEGATAAPVKALIGGDDLKGSDLFVQVGDAVFRTRRTIYNSAAKPANEFRDHRVFTLSSFDVKTVELSRGGSAVVLTKEDADWKLTAPFRGRADAGLVSKMTSAIGNLRVQTFTSDAPSTLAPYGLDTPGITVTIRAGEKAQTLRVGKTDGDVTFVQREGLANVWAVPEVDFSCFRKSADDLRDGTAIGSFAHDSFKTITWKGTAGELEFQFDTAKRAGRLSKPREADVDRDAFEAALACLDGLKAASFLPAPAPAEHLAALQEGRFVSVLLKDATKATKILVGKAIDGGTVVQREGDEYLLVVPTEKLAFLSRPMVDFVSKELLSIDSYVAGHAEIDVTAPSGAGDAPRKQLVYAKNDSAKWTVKGATEEHKGFADLADSLWHAKATEILSEEPEKTAAANAQIEVRVYRKLYNDPQGEEKEKERVATLRFSKDSSGQWLGWGINGKEPKGGFVGKVSAELPDKVLALAFATSADTAPSSQPASSQPAGADTKK